MCLSKLFSTVYFILNIKLPTKSTYYSSSLIKDTLKSNLKLKKNCNRGINYLLLKLFSIDELITSSVLGVSTKKGQRKGLNEDKRSFKVISQFLKKKAIYMSFIFLHWNINENSTDFKIIYLFLILQV